MKISWHLTTWADLVMLVFPAEPKPGLVWGRNWGFFGRFAALEQTQREGGGRESCACCTGSAVFLPAKPSPKEKLNHPFSAGCGRLWEYQQILAGVEETQGKVKAGYYFSLPEGFHLISPKRIRWIKRWTHAHMQMTGGKKINALKQNIVSLLL